MEAVEDGEWHGHVADDGPRPEAEEVQLLGVGVRARGLERVDAPHGEVTDEKKGDHFSSRLVAHLVDM